MQSSQELHFFSHIESVMFFSVRVNRSTDVAPYHKMNIDIMGGIWCKGFVHPVIIRMCHVRTPTMPYLPLALHSQ